MPNPISSTPVSGRHQQVVGAIADAARTTGIDFSYLLGQARLESGLNPTARARTSSATGLYQFIDQSWLAVVDRHGGNHGLGWASNAISRTANGRFAVADPALRQSIMQLRNDPVVSSRMAAEHAADNRRYLEPRIGRTTQPVDLYLAHFLGAGGASRFLNAHAANPSASASALFPQAASANRSIFYQRDGTPRTLAEVRDRFASRLSAAGTGAGMPAMPPAATGATAAADPYRQVEPADWLRLTRQSADRPGGTAGQPHLSAGIDSPPMSAMLHPARARLAYLLLAADGAML